jgi:hypothetical protein
MLQSLEQCTRDDRSTYWAIRPDIEEETREDLQDIIREVHFGELPNDWRFETVREILWQLLEHSDWPKDLSGTDELGEVIPEIADSLACDYDSDTFRWLAENPNRATFSEETELGSDDLDLGRLARRRMVEEIEGMGHALLFEINGRL